MQRRHLRILASIVALGVAQGLLVVVYRWVERERAAAKTATFPYERLPQQPAFDLVLLSQSGATSRLLELRGKPILLHFWATWCPPCRKELPELLELGRALGRDGNLQLVALAVDEDWATVRAFFGGDVPREVVRDATGAAAARYDVSTLPDTYLLDADGSIRLRFNGTREWQTTLARDTLRNALMKK
jgi:thiol-disulfide isomerase/thioredoxin